MNRYFVAGGTSGIGRQCTFELLRRGDEVVAIGRGDEHAEDLRQSVPASLRPLLTVVVGDLTDVATARQVVTAGNPGPVAGLVNSVGCISVGGIETETPERWKSTIATNLDSAFNITQALLPRLRQSSGSSIVNVSSICSRRPCESLSYSVSKAALDMFTMHLAKDLARYSIRVNSVNPGVVKTNLQLGSGLFEDKAAYERWLKEMAALHPLGGGSVEDVASAVLFLLGRGSTWITGTVLAVDGGRAVA
ncbi:MAG: SDR family oxidoreductase [Acidimicrobiales bacterium]|nr:SDR family oxidoreductase [Acidimicrobiales bacterium]